MTLRPCPACDGHGLIENDGELAALRTRVAELEAREPTWDEWIAWMDRHYPANIFTGESGDPGPRAVAAFRAALTEGGEQDARS